MASERAVATLAAANPILQVFECTFEDLKSFINCSICIRPMYEPYTIHCGHSFCYGCLCEWFEKNTRNESCPECRARVTERPAPSFVIREMTRLFFSKPELLPHGETTAEHDDAKAEERQTIEAHKADKGDAGLFPGHFNRRRHHRNVLVDHEDGVERCAECAWELESGYCIQCQNYMGSYSESSADDHDDTMTHWPESEDFSDTDSDDDSDGIGHFTVADRLDLRLPYFDMARDELDMFSESDWEAGTDLDDFIDNDEGIDGQEGFEGHPGNRYGHNETGNQEDENEIYEGDLGHDEDEDESDNPENFYTFDAAHRPDHGQGDDGQSPEESSGSSNEHSEEDSSTSGDSDNDDHATGNGNNDRDNRSTNQEDYPDTESEHAPSVSLTEPRAPENRRKRRRVLESDSEEEDDEDAVAMLPRSRRRLSRPQRTHTDEDQANDSDSTTLGHATPLHNASNSGLSGPSSISTQGYRPYTHHGPSRNSLQHSKQHGRTQASVLNDGTPQGLTRAPDSYQNQGYPPAPDNYNSFVQGWSGQSRFSAGMLS